MNSPLRILHLEDNPNDAALIHFTLEADNVVCAITCVQNRRDFVAALERGDIDLILSDFSLPAFDGLSAAAIAQQGWPLIPFIFVSGTLGEEAAIDSLKRGATDYVVKGRLARLAPAVCRAMAEAEAAAARGRLEADFIESQKMEVLGQLAGGAAHDFNNVLSVIMGYSDLLAMELGLDHPLQKYTDHIRHAAKRAVGLTRQLLVFSRKQKVLPVVLDVNAVVRDLDQMLRRLIDENIEMTIVTEPNLWRVKADSGYVGQVLMNLAVNARDAMPNGGKLTIITDNVTLGDVPGDFVVLRVTDTGTGMTDAVKAHLFEAFFTTKPSGKGTGLGLVTCQTIVQQSGGHIGIVSEVGKGTTFNVFFPRVDQALDHAAGPIEIGPMPGGKETLLVVEDEPSVKNLTSKILESLGYVVLSASNGQDAVRIASTHTGSPIRLVMTDIVMPLMGGRALADCLRTTYPDLKVLFTSGYTDDGVVERGFEFLPKPCTPAALAHKVRHMLDNG